jgi:paraquat-inducible protein A
MSDFWPAKHQGRASTANRTPSGEKNVVSRNVPDADSGARMQTKSSKASWVSAHPRRGWCSIVALLAGLALFAGGIFRPFTTVTKLWLFENQISVFSGLVTLWTAGELFLFLILFVFTVVFPFVKITAMLTLWIWPGLSVCSSQKLFRFVSQMGKWSMLDVFIVAVLVLTVKSGGLASIKVQDGFFLFFTSVILTQFATLWTGKVAEPNKV